MKYAVTDYDGCEYITAGKRYEVISEDDGYFEIMGDNGIEIGICLENSSHLDGNDWRIEVNNDLNKDALDALDRISSAFELEEGEWSFWDSEVITIRAALLNQSNSTPLEKNK